MMKITDLPSEIRLHIIPHFQISSIWIFGSAIRDDYSNDSDIDLVVEFMPGARITLLTLASLQTDLEKVLGRKVDLITRKAIDDFMNPIMRHEVLSTMVRIYGS
ncbi:MAG: nucleotidyltransferase domain-containing protein [Methanospirillum sp.]|uniref:nucleotidyltransferase family protein n=1 Tax=Methanospirillum sp. TaxID=45200 RepID=UPI00236BFAA1|nr:nucleotidyltransferase domain-containing protein [Methanospirillum sp.]MDD1728559.1 nucleotidyltransferase domain-containing protein [Methanospirillum sp.]